MFVKKTTAELSELTPEQVDAYRKELENHEKSERQKEIDEAVKSKIEDAKREMKREIEQEFEAQKKDNNSGTAKGRFVEFAEKNAQAFDDKNKSHSANFTMKAAELMTTANVTPNVAGGFSPLFGNYIDSEIGNVPKPANIIMPLINVIYAPGTESIWYTDRVNEEGDAEFIGEGELKPLIDAEWKTTKKDIKEVAERWKQTKRLINHAPSTVQDFAVHANELIEQKIDGQLLDGDGLGNNLEGLISLSSAFIVPPQLALFYQDANIYDVIMALSTQVSLSNFKGNLTCVLNTVWKAKMQGVKSLDGLYIIPPFVSKDGKEIGGVNIVFSNKISDSNILLGDLKKFNAVIAEDIEYDEGYEDKDFSKNLVSKKLEAFLGTYIKDSDAGAIIYDDISTVLTAIDQP